MPGPYNYPSRPPCSKSPFTFKPPKRPKASFGASSAGEKGEAEMKKGTPAPKNANTYMKNVRVRVICTDPDATDSSSDEDADVKPARARSTNKRVVRELVLPANLALPPSLPGSHGEGYVDVKLSLHKRRGNEGRSSSVSCLSECGSYTSARPRRCGKWAGEIRDTTQGVRVPASSRESLGAIPCLTSDVGEAVNLANNCEPLSSAFDTLQDSLLGASPDISENADSAGSCFFVDSPPSVLGPDSMSPAFLCIPYGSPAERRFSNVFSDEYSDDSVSDIGHKDEESNMRDCLTVADDTSQQKGLKKPEVADGEVKSELGTEANILPFRPFSFTEGLDELGKLFEDDSAHMDEVPDVTADFDSSLGGTDMDFELDSEALAWINFPDTW